MSFWKRFNRSLGALEWRWSLATLVSGLSSFALPAWAVSVTKAFADYAPASWVAAGFAGALTFALIYAATAWGRTKYIRSMYDQNLYKRSGFVDPMAATFENKRIFLSDFVLPSDAYIFGKSFINCEIVGPANLFLRGNYQVHEQKLPKTDVVVLSQQGFFNGIIVEDCSFRGCSFRRITLMMLPWEYERYHDLDWLNWISRPDGPEVRLEQPEVDDTSPPLVPEDSEKITE